MKEGFFMFTNLEMMYADHIIKGFRTIESVPALIRDNVAEILAGAKKKEDGEE